MGPVCVYLLHSKLENGWADFHETYWERTRIVTLETITFWSKKEKEKKAQRSRLQLKDVTTDIGVDCGKGSFV